LLGHYENFPTIPHAKAILLNDSPTETLQRTILKAFTQLNTQEYDQITISTVATNCKIGFEFGIAEGTSFNYLNMEEIERFKRSWVKKTPVRLDFFCTVKYYLLTNSKKRKPLKFDYYLFRFIFGKPTVVLTVFHERGTRRLSIEELIEFLMKQINNELANMKSKPIKIETVMCPVPIENL